MVFSTADTCLKNVIKKLLKRKKEEKLYFGIIFLLSYSIPLAGLVELDH